MKDHQIAQLINQLCSIAEEFAGTQQLRERLARPIRAAFRTDAATVAGNSVVQVCPECDIADCKHIRSNKSPNCACSGRETIYCKAGRYGWVACSCRITKVAKP